MAQLHNVTFYVARDQFAAMREFYAERLGLPVVFEEGDHICCFGVGADMAICVHEAEPGHPAGARELFLWVDHLDGGDDVRLGDPAGNRLRLHHPPDQVGR
jgi:catechol 2,3-dioxygenase-like lactoylglutathione lyase family enzyme